MSVVLTEADLRAIDEDIRASAQNEDTYVLAVLLPLGFSDEPLAWGIEAEEIFDRLVGGAIRSTVNQLQGVGSRIRVRGASTQLAAQLGYLTCKAVECQLMLTELDTTALSNSPPLDPRFQPILQNRLLEARGGMVSFWEVISSLRALLEEKMPVFHFLEQPAQSLEDALQTLYDGPPENVLVYGIVLVETLASMWNERQDLVAEASALTTGLTSRPQDLYGTKCNLHAVAQRLEHQEVENESYVNALTVFINCIDDELPSLHASEQEFRVRDLYNAPAELRLLDAAFRMASNYADTLERMLLLLLTVLEIGTEHVADE